MIWQIWPVLYEDGEWGFPEKDYIQAWEQSAPFFAPFSTVFSFPRREEPADLAWSTQILLYLISIHFRIEFTWFQPFLLMVIMYVKYME